MVHILHCEAHQDLREGRDIRETSDIVRYYVEVMRRRDRSGKGLHQAEDIFSR